MITLEKDKALVWVEWTQWEWEVEVTLTKASEEELASPWLETNTPV